MFNPKYRILITNKCFPRDKVICLGAQLIAIVNYLKTFLPQHMWYGADVEAVGKDVKKNEFNNIQLNLIGDDLRFIDYCSKVEQFMCGVFLCIDSNFLSKNIKDIELETEDKPFRHINCNGILIEIRAFDTTYYEIYSDDLILIKKISEIYKIEIENAV